MSFGTVGRQGARGVERRRGDGREPEREASRIVPRTGEGERSSPCQQRNDVADRPASHSLEVAGDLLHDLVRAAEDVSVILLEAPDSGETVKGPRILVPAAGGDRVAKVADGM